MDTTSPTQMPRSANKNTEPLAWDVFVAKLLEKIAKARVSKAVKAAIAAGVMFDHEDEPCPVGTNKVVYDGDVVRIDHFRGFDSYWAIPAAAPTARTGTWEPGPGLEFFQAVRVLDRVILLFHRPEESSLQHPEDVPRCNDDADNCDDGVGLDVRHQAAFKAAQEHEELRGKTAR